MSYQKCPICLGTGKVCGGFYNCCPDGTPTSGNTMELCRACNGSGTICQYIFEGEGENIHFKQENSSDKEDSITVLKEIRQLLKDILNHQERHV